jgi:hypothetical protein
VIEFPPVELPPLVLPTFDATVDDDEAIPVTARVLTSRRITVQEAADLRRVVRRVRGSR